MGENMVIVTDKQAFKGSWEESELQLPKNIDGKLKQLTHSHTHYVNAEIGEKVKLLSKITLCDNQREGPVTSRHSEQVNPALVVLTIVYNTRSASHWVLLSRGAKAGFYIT